MKTGIAVRAVLALSALVSLTVAASGVLAATNAVLLVSSGLATRPGGSEPLAGRSLLLMKESFESYLRRAGTFDGPPGSTVQASPLSVWAYACRFSMPVCQQALYEARASFVGNAKMDANGRATLPGVPARTYFVFTQAMANERQLIWDLKVVLKPGANSVTLDADRTSEPSSAGGVPSSADDRPCPTPDTPRAAQPGVPANRTLSVTGSGYVYTYAKTERETGRVLESFTERGNFSNATLYLLDEDAESVLESAGIGLGLLGSRFATLLLIENMATMGPGKMNDIAPGLGSMLSLLGGERGTADLAEVVKSAKADFECATKAIRAHSLAQVTTDANARGAFPAVPAGSYYLFGSFYRVQEPVRSGELIWNQNVQVKPGRNMAALSVDNSAWKQP